MRPLTYLRAQDVDDAVRAVAADPRATFLAGGTTEVDLIRLGVTAPDLVVDINQLPLADVSPTADGGVRIGALARMGDVARTPAVVEGYPGLSQALLLGASQQLRNMASMGGNLCQRVRCAYFRDGVSPCNKRRPGSGCSAIEGVNRSHAILGTSDHCIAAHPSDAAVALVAFDATVQTIGPSGTRSIPIDDFYLLPGDTPDVEHPLEHGELIAAIDVPALPLARTSVYLKFRDRQSYEFALVSVLASIDVREGHVHGVRLALGGVGTKPWRARLAAAALLGSPATPDSVMRAAGRELEAAVPRRHNAFKVEFARRAIVRALSLAMTRREP